MLISCYLLLIVEGICFGLDKGPITVQLMVDKCDGYIITDNAACLFSPKEILAMEVNSPGMYESLMFKDENEDVKVSFNSNMGLIIRFNI